MAFEHLTFFEVHVHPGTENSVPDVASDDAPKATTKSNKRGSTPRKVIGLLAASLFVSVTVSVIASRLASRFSDIASRESTAEDPEIEISE